ncbi:hypothetical protein [Halococcus saccharolyticus]|nr:hypothetical protein [Halococcus saccharolyticus]
MSSRAKQAIAVLLGVVLVAFGVHYVLFGSLPLGKPALLESE